MRETNTAGTAGVIADRTATLCKDLSLSDWGTGSPLSTGQPEFQGPIGQSAAASLPDRRLVQHRRRHAVFPSECRTCRSAAVGGTDNWPSPPTLTGIQRWGCRHCLMACRQSAIYLRRRQGNKGRRSHGHSARRGPPTSASISETGTVSTKHPRLRVRGARPRLRADARHQTYVHRPGSGAVQCNVVVASLMLVLPSCGPRLSILGLKMSDGPPRPCAARAG